MTTTLVSWIFDLSDSSLAALFRAGQALANLPACKRVVFDVLSDEFAPILTAGAFAAGKHDLRDETGSAALAACALICLHRSATLEQGMQSPPTIHDVPWDTA